MQARRYARYTPFTSDICTHAVQVFNGAGGVDLPMTGTVLKTSSSKVRVRRRHALAAGGSCSFRIRSTPGAPSRVCCSFKSCRASAVPFTSMTCEKRSPVSAERLLAEERVPWFLSQPKRRSSHLV